MIDFTNPIELLSIATFFIGCILFVAAMNRKDAYGRSKPDSGGAVVGIIIALIGLFWYFYTVKMPNIKFPAEIERRIE